MTAYGNNKLSIPLVISRKYSRDCEALLFLTSSEYEYLYQEASKFGFDFMKKFHDNFFEMGLLIDNISFKDWVNEPGCGCQKPYADNNEDCDCKNISVKIVINIKDKHKGFKLEAEWYLDLNEMEMEFFSSDINYRSGSKNDNVPGDDMSDKMINFLSAALSLVFKIRVDASQENLTKVHKIMKIDQDNGFIA